MNNTKEGRLTGDIMWMGDLREVGKDNAVIEFMVVSSRSKRNPSTNEWEELPTMTTHCTAWGRTAVNIDNLRSQGYPPVMVAGYYQKDENYTDKNGQEVEGREKLVVQNIGIDITHYTGTTSKPVPSNGGLLNGGNRGNAGNSNGMSVNPNRGSGRQAQIAQNAPMPQQQQQQQQQMQQQAQSQPQQQQYNNNSFGNDYGNQHNVPQQQNNQYRLTEF